MTIDRRIVLEIAAGNSMTSSKVLACTLTCLLAMAPCAEALPFSNMQEEDESSADTSITTIKFTDTQYLRVYPSRPGADLAAAGTFRYEVPARLRLTKEHLFDVKTNTVSFEIIPNAVTDEQLIGAKHDIVNHYVKVAPQGPDAGGPATPVITPMSVVAYRLEIEVNDVREVLQDTGIDPTKSGTFGIIKTTDHELHHPEILRVLKANPDAGIIIYRPFYLFQAYEAEKVYASFSRAFVNSVTSEAFGTSPSGKYIVDKKGMQRLRAALVNAKNYTVFGSPDPVLIDLVRKDLDKLIGDLHGQGISDAALKGLPMFVLNQTNLAQELSPEEYSKLATESQTERYVEQRAESVVEKLSEFSSQYSFGESWWNQMRDFVHTFGSFSSDASVSITNLSGDGSASGSLDFTKDFSSLNSGERNTAQNLYNKSKEFHMNKTYYVGKFTDSFKGQDLVRGFQAKQPNFYIVSTADIIDKILVNAEKFKSKAQQLKGPEIRLSVPSEQMYAQAKFTIYVQNRTTRNDTLYGKAQIHVILDDVSTIHNIPLKFKDTGDSVLIHGVVVKRSLNYTVVDPPDHKNDLSYDTADGKDMAGIRFNLESRPVPGRPYEQLYAPETLAVSDPVDRLIEVSCFYIPYTK